MSLISYSEYFSLEIFQKYLLNEMVRRFLPKLKLNFRFCTQRIAYKLSFDSSEIIFKRKANTIKSNKISEVTINNQKPYQ